MAWSQAAAIPVGDFSRGNKNVPPKEPNLFELRVPPTDAEGSAYIANIFRGFRDFEGGALRADADGLKSRRSMAASLASALGRPQADSQFALYMARPGDSELVSSSLAFVGSVGKTPSPDPNALADLTSVRDWATFWRTRSSGFRGRS